MTSRLACLVVPLFPLAARLRCEPELAREALAVFAGNGNAARLVAATRPARRAGLKPGLTLPQARALLPKLVTRPRDPDCERAAQEALLEAAEAVSPRIEDGGEGIAYADLEGLERRFPGSAFEVQAGRALMEKVEAAGLPVRVGIAASKLAARVAADSPGSPTVVPAGEEAAFLSPLPLERLAPEAAVAATLGRWGIRSVGQLARLPAAEVASRLGRLGRQLHAVSRGRDPQPLTPRQPPPSFCEGMTLEWPLVSLEPFLFVGRAALERLCRRLESQGLAAKSLTLSMRLEPDGHYERTIALPAPSHDVKTLLTLVRLEIEARPPGAPVAGFALSAHPDRPRQAQLSLFGPAELSPDRLAATLARLFALLGPGRVGSPRTADGHRPERFALVDYAPPPPPPVRGEPPRGRGLLSVRVLRPPLPVEVITASSPAAIVAEPSPGEPPPELAGLRLLSVAPKVGEETARRPQVRGRVRVASGPWGLEEEWWAEHPTRRDYWDVELAGGGIYRLYRDRESGDWYADGIYD
jgi:protein ImuB